MSIDLTQFHRTFFDESFEGLDRMESCLLHLEGGSPGDTIHTIFRVAHSIKGGAATFGFTPLRAFTHVKAPADVAAPPPLSATTRWRMITPHLLLFRTGNDPHRLISEIARLGTMRCVASLERLPPFELARSRRSSRSPPPWPSRPHRSTRRNAPGSGAADGRASGRTSASGRYDGRQLDPGQDRQDRRADRPDWRARDHPVDAGRDRAFVRHEPARTAAYRPP